MKIELIRLTKEFKDVTAIDSLSTSFEEGKLTSLLGPSGCGKSTLLYMISGILPVTRGSVLFNGEDVTQTPPEKRGVGLVFQNYALYPHMTVLGNISFPMEIRKVRKAERLRKAQELADLVHIGDLLDRKPSQLSGGQQQRAAIARALAKEPDILLLDEPLSNLDARLRLEMREEIRRIQQTTGLTTIFVTHDQEEAMSISDEILILNNGIFQQFDKPQNLYDYPANAFVANFLGMPPINMLSGVYTDEKVLVDGQTIKLPFEAKIKDGKRVLLGIRSEAFVLARGNDACLQARVKDKSITGKEELLYISIGGHDVRALVSSEEGISVGDRLELGFKDRGVFLFDEESGSVLRDIGQ
jgi:multiple sugar transport system ATP-binding protein